MRSVKTFWIVLLPGFAAACGPPVIYDTAHRAVRNPLVTASVDNGWLAVDSTETGIRAVVELQLAAPAGSEEFMSLHLLRLHCTVSGEHIPAKILREAPRCPTPGSPPVECPEGATPEECDTIREQADQTCLFTIRAEFMFDEMPHLDENQHFFTFGQTDQPIRWAKASGY